uniref:Uncharacterized protein n=1 Tax=Candidatus Kentrum sp. FW TaxID=2126338 RepID=A0A450SV72_9GAMM|nr:MAG: hypothetical protein BECKFW1821A_GA0114235_107612 [Candidatus Kentron sp. FW]
MRCRNACRSNWGTGLLVLETRQPDTAVLPEKLSEAVQQPGHIQASVFIHVPGSLLGDPTLDGPGQGVWDDLAIDGIGDLDLGTGADESQIPDVQLIVFTG